jgi:hypothetical protein
MKLSEIEELEKIDRFLAGELEGQELIEFNAKLLSDSAFNQKVEIQRLTNSFLFDTGLMETKEKIKQAHQRYVASQSRPSNFSRLTTICSIAALSLVFSTSPHTNSSLELRVLPIESKQFSNTSNSVEKTNLEHQNSNFEASHSNTNQQSTLENTLQARIEPLPVLSSTYQAKEPQQQIETPVETIQEPVVEVRPSHQVEVKPAENHLVETKSSAQQTNTKSIIPQVVLPIQEFPSQKNTLPCNFDRSILSYTTSSSCEGRSDGSITIKTLFSQKSDYQIDEFSIDGGKTFSKSAQFVRLEPGNYPVAVKLKSGCVLMGDVVEIVTLSSSDCLPTAVHINPELGEFWNIPLIVRVEELIIYNKIGQPVLIKRQLDGYNYEWRGVDSDNRPLPTGAYLYHIRYSNSKEFRGEIFISR